MPIEYSLPTTFASEPNCVAGYRANQTDCQGQSGWLSAPIRQAIGASQADYQGQSCRLPGPISQATRAKHAD